MTSVFLYLSLPCVHQHLREFLWHVYHHSMATGHPRRLPGRIVPHPLIELGERTRSPSRRIHVHSLRYSFPCSAQRQFLLQTPERVVHTLPINPGPILPVDPKPFSGQRGNPEPCALCPRRVSEARCPLWPYEVHEALPVGGEEGAQVDERTKPRGGFVRSPRNHHPAVTVPAEDDI